VKTLDGFPFRDVIVFKDGKVTRLAHKWFDAIRAMVLSAVHLRAAIFLEDQGAAIPAGVAAAALPAGVYRASAYVRVTRPATVSSSVTLTLAWTRGGILFSVTGSPVNGNTTGSAGLLTWLFRIDADTPIQYATNYASVGATSMQYELDVVVESVSP
jgi:hypothetical protein